MPRSVYFSHPLFLPFSLFLSSSLSSISLFLPFLLSLSVPVSLPFWLNCGNMLCVFCSGSCCLHQTYRVSAWKQSVIVDRLSPAFVLKRSPALLILTFKLDPESFNCLLTLDFDGKKLMYVVLFFLVQRRFYSSLYSSTARLMIFLSSLLFLKLIKLLHGRFSLQTLMKRSQNISVNNQLYKPLDHRHSPLYNKKYIIMYIY